MKELEVAKRAAKKAGLIMRRNADNVLVSHKGDSFNLVTQTDTECEKTIIGMIRKAFPTHSILSEEGTGKDALDSEHLWVIDPLDGTNNYAHGLPQYCVSIAYARKGVVQAGVIFDPERRELFEAVLGRGAHLNGKRIRVSKNATLKQAVVAMGTYYDRSTLMEKTLLAVRDLYRLGVQGIRRMGSAALDLAWLACGRYEAYFEYKLHPWDFAAGALLVQEAGGICADRLGAPLRLDSEGMIASNGLCHRELQNAVLWRERGKIFVQE